MNKKIALIGIGLVTIFVGYMLYLKVQAEKLMEQVEYKLQNFQLKNVGLTNVRITSDLVITNPSKVAFTITDYNINVEVQGTTVTTLKGGGTAIVVGANQSTTIPFDVQFDPRKIAQNLLPLFLDVFLDGNKTSEIGVRYVGTLSGKFGGLGFSNLPIDYTYQP
jgi:LEA14-like dessication related protein